MLCQSPSTNHRKWKQVTTTYQNLETQSKIWVKNEPAPQNINQTHSVLSITASAHYSQNHNQLLAQNSFNLLQQELIIFISEYTKAQFLDLDLDNKIVRSKDGWFSAKSKHKMNK